MGDFIRLGSIGMRDINVRSLLTEQSIVEKVNFG